MIEELEDADGIERDFSTQVGRSTATGARAVDGAAQGVGDGAACEVKRGGSCGRGRGEFEKNSGDGGCKRLIDGPEKVKRS